MKRIEAIVDEILARRHPSAEEFADAAMLGEAETLPAIRARRETGDFSAIKFTDSSGRNLSRPMTSRECSERGIRA